MIGKLYSCDMEAAVKGIRENLPDAVREIISWADETLSGVICHRAHYEMEKCFVPVPFSDSIWDNVPEEIANRDPEWLYALNRHSILLNLAKAFALTGRMEYKDKFIEMITSYLDNTSYSSAHTSTSWRSLETGIRPENWIRSICLFEDSGSPLPDSLLERMEASLREHIRQLEDTHRAFQRLSNWGVIQEHGLFIAGLALDDDVAVSIALERLEEELSFSVLEDGEQWEQSPMYHLEVLHSALDTVFIARKEGVAVPALIEEKTRLLSSALYEMTLPGGNIMTTGDSDEMNASDLIYLSSYLFSLPYERAKSEENWWDLGDRESKAPAVGRKSMLHRASGNAFLRSGDLTVHMISGLMGSGHGHISPLHVDISKGESLIVTDSGRYTYTESAEREALKDAEAHNVFIIDDDVPERAVGSWGYNAIYEKTLGDISGCGEYEAVSGMYFGSLPSGIVQRRKAVRIADKLVVVLDEVLGDEKKVHSYRGLWHIHPSFVLSDSSKVSDGSTELFISSTADKCIAERYSYSPTYNVMQSGDMLSFSAEIHGMDSVATVFSVGEKAEIERIGVSLMDAKRDFTETEALAIRIKRSDGEWIILSRSHEIPAQVDIMKAGFLEGYGRLLVMERGEKYPTRLM